MVNVLLRSRRGCLRPKGLAGRVLQGIVLRPPLWVQCVGRSTDGEFRVPGRGSDVENRIPHPRPTEKHIVNATKRRLSRAETHLRDGPGHGKMRPDGGQQDGRGQSPDQVRPHWLSEEGRRGGPDHQGYSAHSQGTGQKSGIDEAPRATLWVMSAFERRGHVNQDNTDRGGRRTSRSGV